MLPHHPSALDYLRDVSRQMDSGYPADCVTHAVRLAELLLEAGASPWIGRIRDRRGDWHGPLMPRRFARTPFERVWSTHYVCCVGDQAWEPMAGEPIAVAAYSEVIFGQAFPVTALLTADETAEAVRNGNLRETIEGEKPERRTQNDELRKEGCRRASSFTLHSSFCVRPIPPAIPQHDPGSGSESAASGTRTFAGRDKTFVSGSVLRSAFGSHLLPPLPASPSHCGLFLSATLFQTNNTGGNPMAARFLALLLSLVLGVTALAQEPPQQTPPAEPPADEQPLLDAITVTAQKRAEDVQDVPAAVTAMPEEQVETLTTAGADVKAISGRVPSLLIESSFGRAFPRFYIRGLGNTDFDLNASQPVSMIYDEVVLENPVLKGMPVWDVDRIEVLRGPQGTLFGRNTPAGIVKFESKQPSQDFDAYLRGSYGSFGTIDFKGAVGGGITENLSSRFAFLYQTQNDWIDNAHTGEDGAVGGYRNIAARLQFLWKPVVRATVLFNLHAWDIDGTSRIFRANILRPGSNELVPGYAQDTVQHDARNEQTIESQGGVVRAEYAFDRGTLTSVTGFDTLQMFSRGDIDGGFGASFAPPFGPGFIPFYSESSDGIPDLDQFTQEVRYASNTQSKFQWLTGAFLFHEKLQAETVSYTSLAPGNPEEGFASQEQDAESWAVFFSGDYRATEKWHLRGGLRFTHDEKELSAERPRPLAFNTATIRPVRATTDDDFLSWDVSATYAMSPSVNFYGRVATGFRAPSIQGRILFAPDQDGGTNPATDGLSVAETEEILSGEVGFKSELFNRRLRVNGTVYSYVVDGQQITAVGGEFNVATLLNADKTRGYGFEADVNYAPARDWRVTLGASYNHTEIDDPNLSIAPCGGGCTVLDPIGPNGALVDGNSLPHAPEWIFNGIVDYRRPMVNGELIGSLDLAYSSEKQFFLYESREFRSDAFELGLRFGYAFGERYELALFGRNVTDEVVVQNGIDFNNLTGMTNDPRIVGVELVIRF
ncbi:MAG TPA: TonB-dependent receptor [Thermoanaerobaculia bacterium]